MVKHVRKLFSSAVVKRRLIVTVLLLVLNLSAIPAIYSGTTPTVKVINPETGDGNFMFHIDNMAVGDRFNATVWLYNVTDLFAYQVKLYVDDTLLNITDAWIPDWDPEFIFHGLSYIPMEPALYDDDGDGVMESVLVGASLLGEASVSGSGLLAIIEFEVMLAPSSGKVSCSLDIDNADTYLLKPGNPPTKIEPIIRENGYYELTAEASITIAADPVNATFGSVMTISGRIIPKTPGETVHIWCRRNVTGDPWTKIGTAITNDDGEYSYEWTTDRLGALNLKANWTVESKIILVNVKYESTISLSLSHTNVTTGTVVTISGDINPDRENVNVTIYYRNPDLYSDWKSLANVTTNAEGKYEYNWTATKMLDQGTTEANDTFQIKAYWKGDSETWGDESQPQNITVWKRHVSLTINAPQTAPLASTINITGTITPPLPNAEITIRCNVTGVLVGELTFDNDSATTDSEGNYIYLYQVPSYEDRYRVGDNITFMAFFCKSQSYFNYFKDFFKLTDEKLAPKTTVTITAFPSNITLHVEPTSTTIYSNVTLTGRITSEEPIPEGRRVTFEYRTVGSTSWRLLKHGGVEIHADTNATGHFHLVWNVTLGGEYDLRACWEGWENVSGAYSNAVRMVVEKISPSLTLEADPQTVKIGSNITLSGTLYPAINTTITLYYRNSTENTWHRLKSALEVVYGNFSYIWETEKAGTFEIRACWKGNDIFKGINSTVSVTVTKCASYLTINVDSETVTVGSNITISGTLSLEQETLGNVSGATIIIRYKTTENGEWTDLATVKTNVTGTYTYVWNTNQTGTFIIKAFWAGDEYHDAAESEEVTVTVESLFQRYLPYIAMGAAAIIAVVIIIVFLVLKKRGKT